MVDPKAGLVKGGLELGRGIKSGSLIVPARINVDTTSAGGLTSAAPLSMTKSNVTVPFIWTGTTNVPPSIFSSTRP
jgi:hypothetical protein